MQALRSLLFAPLGAAIISAGVSSAVTAYQVLALAKCDPKLGCAFGAQFAIMIAATLAVVSAFVLCLLLYSYSRMVSPIRDGVFYVLIAVIGLASALWSTGYAWGY